MLKKGDVRLGIAPIAWTNDDMPELGGEISFEQCIDEMALAGYVGSEVGNKQRLNRGACKLPALGLARF